MRVFVLYDKSGIHSGRKLGAYLIREFAGRARVEKGRPRRLELLLRRGARFDYIINVGWFKNFPTGGASVLNPPGAISKSSNKRGARRIFAEKGVPAPELWLSSSHIPVNKFPVVGRTSHHTKGKGFWLCHNTQEAHRAQRRGATHFIKFVQETREFRVHIAAPKADLAQVQADDYVVFKTSEKLPKPGARRNTVIKNHRNGWVFSYPQDRQDPALRVAREAARKAIAPFGLHWGAVDVLIDQNGEARVLEINSTPCLTDDQANTIVKYHDVIASLIGLREPMQRRERREPRRVEEPRRAQPRRENRGRSKLQRLLAQHL